MQPDCRVHIQANAWDTVWAALSIRTIAELVIARHAHAEKNRPVVSCATLSWLHFNARTHRSEFLQGADVKAKTRPLVSGAIRGPTTPTVESTGQPVR